MADFPRCFSDRVRFGIRRGKDPSQDIVPAGGNADRCLDLSSSVKLRRPAGPGSRAPRKAAKGGFDETHLEQLLEMEGRQFPAHPDGQGSLISADLPPAGHDVLIDRSPRRLGERSGSRELLLICHLHILRLIS